MTIQASTIGALGIGAMPNPTQRSRIDAGDIELGRVRIGFGIMGGVAFPANGGGEEGNGSTWLIFERRRGRR